MTAAPSVQPTGQHYCPTCERMYPSGDVCPADGARLMKIKQVVDPLIGRVLDGRYTIREKLGQGGMGAVYRAAQHSVDREVAIKVVNAHLVSDEQAIRRFLREAKIASKLTHPNAVAVLDFGQSDDGLFYLVMELVSGRTLEHVYKTEGVLRPDRLLRIGMQVCDALESAHALQIIHRDLKPANIMLLAQTRDHVKVLDFGLAKSVDPDAQSTTMTNAGALLGTPAYMPPEVALGRPCDARSDLYSLGCVLYLLGCGRLPFVYDTPHEMIAAHGTEPAPPMDGVPPALAAIVARLLEKEPAARFQSAAELREALEAARDSRTTPLPFHADSGVSLAPYQSAAGRSLSPSAVAPTMAAMPTPTPAPRGRSMRMAALAALLVLGAGAGAFALTRQHATSDTPPAAHVEPPAPAIAAPAPAASPPATPPPVTPPPVVVAPPAAATTPPATPETAETRPMATTSKPAKPQKPAKPSRPAVTKPAPTPPATKPPPEPAPTPTPTPPPATGTGSGTHAVPF